MARASAARDSRITNDAAQERTSTKRRTPAGTAPGKRVAPRTPPAKAKAKDIANRATAARDGPKKDNAARDAIRSPIALQPQPSVRIRPVRPGDLEQVIAIDSIVTGLEKRAYWRTIHRRYGDAERAGRRFLVAEAGGRVAGFVIGEVRDWEFGSPPCGWVFAIDVHPEFRLAGLGTHLVDAMSNWFRREGVSKLRTILARDNTLILSFFRSMGMTTGPFIPLEMDLDEAHFPAGGRIR